MVCRADHRVSVQVVERTAQHRLATPQRRFSELASGPVYEHDVTASDVVTCAARDASGPWLKINVVDLPDVPSRQLAASLRDESSQYARRYSQEVVGSGRRKCYLFISI